MVNADHKKYVFSSMRDQVQLRGFDDALRGFDGTDAVLPALYRKNIAGMLLSQDQIGQGLAAVAAQLNRDYERYEIQGAAPVVLVTVLHGAMVFSSDLMRQLCFPFKTDSIAVSSYEGTESTGTYQVKKDISHPVAGKQVLLVEDIVDTGGTLDFLAQHIKTKNPASLQTVALLDKADRRKPQFAHVSADYTCFVIPDVFVIGYGLDYEGYFRGMPFVAVKKT